MLRILFILCLVTVGSLSVASSGMAQDSTASKLEEQSRQLRVQIAQLDRQLKQHLVRSLRQYGDQSVQCGPRGERRSLAECVRQDTRDLTRITITLAKTGQSSTDPSGALADAEERYALFTEEMNKTNDLLASAGAKVYQMGQDITPAMDQLRRDVIFHIERKRSKDLRTKQAMLIATLTVILIGIFTVIFFAIRRIRWH